MVRLLLLAGAVGLAVSISNFALDQCPNDSQPRPEVLIDQSETIGKIDATNWRHFYMNDQPSHMTYERAHGGVGP